MARKTKEDTQKTIVSILDAAELIFVENGVANTTIANIADAAGVSKGAVYGHYTDKIQICVAVCERALTQISSITSRVEGEAHLDTLCRWGVNYLNSGYEYPSLRNVFEILYLKCEKSPEFEPLWKIRATFEMMASRASLRVLRKAVASGELPPNIDLELTNVYLQSLLEGIGCKLWWMDEVPDDFWPRAEKLMQAGIDTMRLSKALTC